eukprot:snap_masked-scaffold_17-processed-gene-6.53-mRNA-1 protein AED:1.00 eAED:1.00 QI:0/0/0/0/1/1/2/0/75
MTHLNISPRIWLKLKLIQNKTLKKQNKTLELIFKNVTTTYLIRKGEGISYQNHDAFSINIVFVERAAIWLCCLNS